MNLSMTVVPGCLFSTASSWLPSGTTGRHDNELIYIYREQRKQKLCDSSRQRLAPNVYISLFIGLSLKEYAVACGADCQTLHMQPCLECAALLSVANYVSQEGYCMLSEAFKMSFCYSTIQGKHCKAMDAADAPCMYTCGHT